MRKIPLLISFFISLGLPSYGQLAAGDYIEVTSYNHYKYRPDGKPGREIYVSYRGKKQIKNGKIYIKSSLGEELIPFKTARPDSIPVLLPEHVGVSRTDTIVVGVLASGKKMYTQTVIPKMRHWNIYIYPHSHVDIGYTNTQKNVEFIHRRNLDVAMELAEQTADYPVDARFKWNPEVTWPVERYLAVSSPEKRHKLIEAIKNGQIVLDAGYLNVNTSAASDEELLELFRSSTNLEKLTGIKPQTMVQVDIPGVSWGIVPVAEQLGIKYVLSLYNGVGRIGLSPRLNFRPFWWKGPDNKSKVLFLQPGAYNPGALAKGKDFWPLLAGQPDSLKLMRVVKTDNPRANFIDSYIAEKLPELENDEHYIYDIFPMTWCMADNTPIDADLPDAVKSWNEEYAFPHLKICSATEMMDAFASRYGDKIPEESGDITEYWTDGLGSSAKHTGKNREIKEELVQAEILWSLLYPGKPAPRMLIEDAWRHILLSTEHTWSYMNPGEQPMTDEISKVKFGYFDKAVELTDKVMDQTKMGIASVGSGNVAVFNTNSWSISSLVYLDPQCSKGYSAVVDSHGKEVLSQRLTTGELVFYASDVPALGQKLYKLIKKGSAAKSVSSKVNLSPFVLDNGIVSVTIDAYSGDVRSIIYKGEEFVNTKGMTAVNSYRYLLGGNSSGFASVPYNTTVVRKECGPLVNSFLVKSDAEGTRSLQREIRLVYNSENIEFINRIDKLPVMDKESVHFGFGFNVPDGRTKVNLPWATMELDKDQIDGSNKNWIAVNRWLDVTNGKKGVTWCPVNAVCFESGDITANLLDYAVDSPKWIEKLPESQDIYSWAMNNHWITNFPLTQEGIAQFKYVIRPYLGDYKQYLSNQFGVEQFRPLVPVEVSDSWSEPQPLGRFELKGSEKVYLSNYRTSQDGKEAVVRLISMSDEDERVGLSFSSVTVVASYIVKEGLDDGCLEHADLSSVVVPANGSVTLKLKWK